MDSGWDALSDTLKSVRPSLRSDSASRPASALTAVSDPVFRDVRNCAYRSLSRAVSFSARPRELTNTRVVWCFSTSSSTLRSMAGHTEPPVETREVCSSPPTEVSPLRSADASMAGPTPEICVVWRFGSFTAPALRPASSETGSRMAESGSTTFRSMSGCDSGLMTRTGRVPPRKRAASAGGSTVAESPMRWTDRPARLSNRSKLSARCAPRLEPAMACTSSTITVSTAESIRRALEVSSRNSDSGVVTRISGGWLTILRRSCGVVSPLRMPTLTFGDGNPIASHCPAMPANGAWRFLATSTPRAFNGEIYRTLTPRTGLRFLALQSDSAVPSPPPDVRNKSSPSFVIRRSIAERKAHNVLPEPVGATTNTFSPERMAGHAKRCASVGALNACLNQALVASENKSMHSYIRSIMASPSDIIHNRRKARHPPSSAHSSTPPG